MSWRVPFFQLSLGQAEVDAVAGVIHSGWLTMGERTRRFEEAFAGMTGRPHGVAVNSGTAALHLALRGLGIGPGDEVVCPALTFVATANAIRHCGARPVFADVAGLDHWNLGAAQLEAVLTERTRALLVVHFAGYACDMPGIIALARSHGLAVVEDAAHAPGASLQGIPLGGWGDAGCFSFFSNKNLTTGEGGMLVTERPELADQARLLRSHGMTASTLDRHRGHAFGYDVIGLGYNFRMGELNAALGLAQLDGLKARNRRRGELVARYRDRLDGVEGLVLPFADAPGEPAYHLQPVLLPEGVDRERVMGALREAGIQTSIHYRPIDGLADYCAEGLGPVPQLEVTHAIGDRALSLPLYPELEEEQVDYVANQLGRLLAAG
ncbi:MAG: DegT/DnrJ/EryC1/StrS aminotransferase family protein [Chromatiales bacterium]|jgi:dTDP-4-amino-4,6-dideoxygalactose transaminase